MTMLERIARAICAERDGCPVDEANDLVTDYDRDLARAVLEAMREPTMGMTGSGIHSAEGAAVWRAMIDAALLEGVWT